MELPQSRSYGISLSAFVLLIVLLAFPVSMSAASSGSTLKKAELTISPQKLAFGDVVVGKTSTLTVVLSAVGGDVNVSSISSNSSLFGLPGLKLPLKIPMGKDVMVKVTFTPQKDGNAYGDLGVSSDAGGSPISEPVGGTGTGGAKTDLTISPQKLDFGNVAVGTSSNLTLGLSATGGDVEVSSITSNSSLFDAYDVQFPLKISMGKEVLVNVTFTPKKDGNASGDLSFISNAADSPTSEPLVGTGTAPYVSLSWIASKSEGVRGYNVYRSTSKNGSGSKINSRLDSQTAYNDKTVVSGKTYYYTTTAVNASGEESKHSEQVKVWIP